MRNTINMSCLADGVNVNFEDERLSHFRIHYELIHSKLSPLVDTEFPGIYGFRNFGEIPLKETMATFDCIMLCMSVRALPDC